MLACVSFLRFCPWKLAPPSSSPLPSLGRKLFCEAQASISVPSTEKCSSDNSGLTCGWFKSLVMNLANTSPLWAKLPGGLGSYVPIDEQAPLSSTTREAASRNNLALRSSPRPVSIPRRSHKPLHEPRE